MVRVRVSNGTRLLSREVIRSAFEPTTREQGSEPTVHVDFIDVGSGEFSHGIYEGTLDQLEYALAESA